MFLPEFRTLHYSCATLMRDLCFVLSLVFATLAAPLSVATAQQSGRSAPFVFTGSTDIGKTLKGSTLSGPRPGTFRITGGGSDMWGSEDAFHLDWVRLVGDATLTAEVNFPADATPLAKGVLIFRQSLKTTAAYADVAIHGDGHVTLQYRLSDGSSTRDVTSPEHGSTRIRIERKGDLFTASTADAYGKFTVFASQRVTLAGPVYVGLGVCSHNANGLATVTFADATLKHTAQLLPVMR